MKVQNQGEKSAKVKQKNAYIGYSASPQCSVYLNMEVSKIKFGIARFNMTNKQNIILKEACIRIIVHTLFRKYQP